MTITAQDHSGLYKLPDPLTGGGDPVDFFRPDQQRLLDGEASLHGAGAIWLCQLIGYSERLDLD